MHNLRIVVDTLQHFLSQISVTANICTHVEGMSEKYLLSAGIVDWGNSTITYAGRHEDCV